MPTCTTSRAGEATWGDGNESTDWRLAAERAGNAILEVNPDWLIVVEGVETYDNDYYWWGGNLAGAKTAPVRLSRPGAAGLLPARLRPGVWRQGWFDAPDFPENLPADLGGALGLPQDRRNIAPVLLGEFGGRSVEPTTTRGSGSGSCSTTSRSTGSATPTGPGTRTPVTPVGS